MSIEKKANHQANIVRITEILTHTNADSLEIIPIGEYQAISRKGQFKVGDLAVYIQPDSIVPQTEPFRFIWEPYLKALSDGPNPLDMESFGVPERKRRITVRKFRGEWSEGLLLPLADFPDLLLATQNEYQSKSVEVYEGADVSDVLGITHYDPDSGKAILGGQCGSAPKRRRRYPHSLKEWVPYLLSKLFRRTRDRFDESANGLSVEVYDVDAYKNYPHVFVHGESVVVSEKIHGSNARYVYLDGIMYAGSHRTWKAADSLCIFRKVLKNNPWIEAWCKAHEGCVLRGEVTPTQKGFDYGSKEPQLFVFDAQAPDGRYLGAGDTVLEELIDHFVPILYDGPFNIEIIKSFIDGASTVEGAKNIREGVVVRTVPERHVRGLGRAQLKFVSNSYLEKDNK
jgi:hypothetical protein